MPIYSGHDIDADKSIECDVCIVGSGAGGAHVAARIAATGKRVVMLEDGSFHTSDTFTMTEAEMLPRLYQEGGARATADGSIVVMQGRAVGGTTVVNWTTCFRTPAPVFDHWAEHHGVEGPSHAAFVPHWKRVEERLHIHQMTLAEVNRNNMVLWRGAEKLGWKPELLYRNVNRCAHTGYCGMGCPIDAKQSMLATMIPEAVTYGADVYANTWVERIERDGRRATKVIGRVRNPNNDRFNGHTLTVKAKLVVLAGGGINTPAILLRSQINPNGRTGFRTFLHPAVGVVGIHDERIEAFKGSPQYVACHHFWDRGRDKAGFLLENAPVFPAAAAGFTGSFGRDKQAFMDLLPHMSISAALLRDGFDVSDRDEGAVITLKDNGHPKIDYKWTPRLEEGFREITRRTAEVQLAGGAKRVVTFHAQPRNVSTAAEIAALGALPCGPGQISVFSAHVMGGCAMGTDPNEAVVDSRTLRHHDLDNLFVVDGSVYPTSLGVNPQLSIYGLASWGAEHIKQALA